MMKLWSSCGQVCASAVHAHATDMQLMLHFIAGIVGSHAVARKVLRGSLHMLSPPDLSRTLAALQSDNELLATGEAL